MPDHDKSTRGNASQFFVAGELCRRGHVAVVTLGNTPNTDILCSNRAGTRFVHIQVKTFVPGSKTCSVGLKAEKIFGPAFFWVLGGIPGPGSKASFEYFIIPSQDMAQNVQKHHKGWLASPGMNGRAHKDSKVRVVNVSPRALRISGLSRSTAIGGTLSLNDLTVSVVRGVPVRDG